MASDDPSYPVWHLLRTMLPVDLKVPTVASPVSRDEFVEAISSSLPQHIGRSGRLTDLDAKAFSERIGLSGTSLFIVINFVHGVQCAE